MSDIYWITKEYQRADGSWIPQVHICEEDHAGVTVTRILGPEHLSLPTREEARRWSDAIGAKYIRAEILRRSDSAT